MEFEYYKNITIIISICNVQLSVILQIDVSESFILSSNIDVPKYLKLLIYYFRIHYITVR